MPELVEHHSGFSNPPSRIAPQRRERLWAGSSLRDDLRRLRGFHRADEVLCDVPAEYRDGDVARGSLGGSLDIGNGFGEIVVLGGDQGTNYDFGVLKLGTVAGWVFGDANQNDQLDQGETGLPDVTIVLEGVDDQGNALRASAITDQHGHYVFRQVSPGDYQVFVEGQQSDQEVIPSTGFRKSLRLLPGDGLRAIDLLGPLAQGSPEVDASTPEQEEPGQAAQTVWQDYPETLDDLDLAVSWAAGSLAAMPAVAHLASIARQCRSKGLRALPWA